MQSTDEKYRPKISEQFFAASRRDAFINSSDSET